MSSSKAIHALLPNCDSSASQWIAFHKEARKRYGRIKANTLFMALWQKRTDDGALLGDEANTRELREYMEKQGVTIEGGVLDTAQDFVGGIWDGISGFGKTMYYLFVAVLVLTIVAVGFLVFKSINDPKYAGKVAGNIRGGKKLK